MKKYPTLLLILFLVSTGYTQSVKIGNQEWSTKNIDVTSFRNGDLIFEAKTFQEWTDACYNKQPAWCFVYYDKKNEPKYGKLYNWFAVNDSRGLTPEGWHVPSKNEWEVLINFLGGSEVAGKKMKSTNDWNGIYIDGGILTDVYPDKGTNSSGFLGLSSAICTEGSFNGMGDIGCWWSSSEDPSDFYKTGPSNAYGIIIRNDSSFADIWSQPKKEGYSVRCIKN